MKSASKSRRGAGDGSRAALAEQLVIDYAPLVSFIAGRIAAGLPKSVDQDDLVSVGFLGLLDAIDKFDPTRDNKFKTYAEWRIRGAILDELRSQDTVSRSIRDQLKRLDKSVQELEQSLRRTCTAEELAAALQITVDDVHRIKGHILRATTMIADGLVDNQGQDPGPLPLESVELKELRDELSGHIDRLKENERVVLALLYFEQLTMREVGVILAVSESRVSQIHAAALKQLRQRFLRTGS